MSTHDPFRFDYERFTASLDLRPEHHSEFQRLVKILRYGTRSQLLILEFNDEPYRDLLMRKVDDVLAVEGLRSDSIDLVRGGFATFADAEAELVRLAKSAAAIHVLGGDAWFDDARWESFNIRRESIARNAPARLLLWLTEGQIRKMAERAPDLWSWRSAVLDFSTAVRPSDGIVSVPFEGPRDPTMLAEKAQRIAELRAMLTSEPALAADVKAPLLDELATLLTEVGRPDEALRIRQEEELPVYERLGDVRSRAVTLGRVADMLQRRGQFDEALRIRQEEELPVYERLGDVRSRAVTLGKIADILQARGQLDEALRIRQEEQLPVFERLGDMRSRAITLGRIADILQGRGQLDEALRIRQRDELPVFEALGDVRERSITMAKIAGVLTERNERDEAHRLFSAALADARALRIPEAEQIATMMRGAGFEVPEDTSQPTGAIG